MRAGLCAAPARAAPPCRVRSAVEAAARRGQTRGCRSARLESGHAPVGRLRSGCVGRSVARTQAHDAPRVSPRWTVFRSQASSGVPAPRRSARATRADGRVAVPASSDGGGSRSGYRLEIDPSQVAPGGVRLTDAQKATLDAFWREHGVSSKTHRATLTRVGETKGLFRDPDRLVERMVELEDVMWRAVGVADVAVGAVVGRYPKSLYFDPDFLVERLRLLRDLLPGADLKKLIERNPQILAMDMTHTLPAKMRELSVLLPNSDVVRLIETHPKLLSVNVQSRVRANLADLKGMLRVAGVVDTAVEVMVVHNPRLLTSDIRRTVAKRATRLESLRPGAIAFYAEKPASLSRILCASERALDRLAYVDEHDKENEASVIVTVNTPGSKFEKKYPGFDAWQKALARSRAEAESAANDETR